MFYEKQNAFAFFRHKNIDFLINLVSLKNFKNIIEEKSFK